MSLEVVRPGPLALVQDAGRPGFAAVGVSPSGAFDRAAFTGGARLVGNQPDRQAAIEVTLGGLVVRARNRLVVALTGATCPATVDGVSVGWGEPVVLAPGALLAVGLPASGLRSYLSVAGGIAVDPVLGSRSSDLLSGLGPPRLSAGMVLPVGDPVGPPVAPGFAGPDLREPTAPDAGVTPADGAVLQLLPGPRLDWLAEPAALATDWVVAPQSNRIGVRLSGPALDRAAPFEGAELPSEPLVRGAVQLPPSGQPLVFGPDHPTTGGYPVVAVLTEQGADRLAQCRPGATVRLRWAQGPD